MNTIKPDQANESLALASQPAPIIPTPSGDLIAFARSQEELHQSQDQLIAWSAHKLNEARQHLSHMEANLEQAKQYSWALVGFRSAVLAARKQMEFYEKLHAAFAAGYCVVPDFPIDVFAVRTVRVAPPVNQYESDYSWSDTRREQRGEALPLGIGEYVSDQPVVMQQKQVIPQSIDRSKTTYLNWSESFQNVDFPIKTAAITVLDATGRALAAKIFDEIGILPERKKPKSDPMVIGRVQYRHGKKERTVSFVIAWFLRESDLTV